MTSSTTPAAEHKVTAFEGAETLGIRYEDQVTCIECSVKIDSSDEAYELEREIVLDKHCALCRRQI